MLMYSNLIDIAFGTVVYMYGPGVLPMLAAGGTMWLAIYSFGAAFLWMQLGVSRTLLSYMSIKDQLLM